MRRSRLPVILLLLLFFSFLFTACEKAQPAAPQEGLLSVDALLEELDEIDRSRAEEERIRQAIAQLCVILHAGGQMDGYPPYMNSQEAFLLYYGMGYRYFEYDFRLSSDGRLIGTHNGENILTEQGEPIADCSAFTYEQFKALRLSGGYTPVNEEWLLEAVKNYPDAKFIIDAKMPSTEGDIAVLSRLEAAAGEYGCDVSSSVIPEVFSKEMWDIVKESLHYEQYIFSHYKVWYSAEQILTYFDDPRIFAVSLPLTRDAERVAELSILSDRFRILVFTPYCYDDILAALAMHADGVYVDMPAVLTPPNLSGIE